MRRRHLGEWWPPRTVRGNEFYFRFNKVDYSRISTAEKQADALGCQPKDLQ